MDKNCLEQLNRAFEDIRRQGVEIRIFDEIDSTNTEAKRYCLGGGSVPALFWADGQTSGRGRMGRSFYSPSESGIYLSLLTAAPQDADSLTRVTSAAAVALHRAIFDELGIDTGIKWVNDLYFKGKKIAGILAESFFVGDTRYIIIGAGINLSTAVFPEELRGKAGALVRDCGSALRARLSARAAHNLLDCLDDLGNEEMVDYYRAHSVVLGRAVTFCENGEEYRGVAESIDGLGRLSVRLENGGSRLLSGGEISLRLD